MKNYLKSSCIIIKKIYKITNLTNRNSMSASTKQKHVFLETINNLTLPADNQQIVKVYFLIN